MDGWIGCLQDVDEKYSWVLQSEGALSLAVVRTHTHTHTQRNTHTEEHTHSQTQTDRQIGRQEGTHTHTHTHTQGRRRRHMLRTIVVFTTESRHRPGNNEMPAQSLHSHLNTSLHPPRFEIHSKQQGRIHQLHMFHSAISFSFLGSLKPSQS